VKYFIYTRKSTDSEERQILSIESQISELKEFAAKEKLVVRQVLRPRAQGRVAHHLFEPEPQSRRPERSRRKIVQSERVASAGGRKGGLARFVGAKATTSDLALLRLGLKRVCE